MKIFPMVCMIVWQHDGRAPTFGDTLIGVCSLVLPGMPGWDENVKATVIKKVLEAVAFWTGNLPTDPANRPTPVTAPPPGTAM